MPESVPFADPPYLCGIPSPYYKPTHLRWQKACRAFLDEHVNPYALEWDAAGKVPETVFETFAKHNMLIPSLPAPLPVEWLHRLGIHEILGTSVDEWDYTHMAIYGDEMVRHGLMGIGTSLTTGLSYAVPPLYKFGSAQLQERFLPRLLTGAERTCIAITEPDAGSDVAGITTTAKRSADGRHFVVNGAKKWITNGIWAAWATMAVRTGGPGPGGLSLLVVPVAEGTPGVSKRHIRTGGGGVGGTTFIELDDVLVPVENLVGTEGLGMRYIMTNFNHERLSIAVGATRQARAALAAAMGYVMAREAFGQPLVTQPVVRQRLARCGAMLESQQAWVEQFVYALAHMPKAEADTRLGGLTAMAKAQAGVVLDECARTAYLLHGGNGLTSSGKGQLVEKIYREVPGIRVPGGSEDVLFDLGVRQLVKNFHAAKKRLQGGKL